MRTEYELVKWSDISWDKRKGSQLVIRSEGIWSRLFCKKKCRLISLRIGYVVGYADGLGVGEVIEDLVGHSDRMCIGRNG